MRCRPSWRTTICASVWRPVRAASAIGCRRGRTPWTRWPPRSRGSTPMDDSLAAHCHGVGAAGLFALTYNGESRYSPIEPEDDAVRELMNRHQRSNDKGFGRAAGPDAVDAAERCFSEVGYRVQRASSDWIL